MKAQEGHLEKGKTAKPAKSTKSGKPTKIAKKSQQKLKRSKTHKTPRETDFQCKLSPLDRHYHVSSLSTTRLAKNSTNSVHILSPFGNELIKHNLREE
jgi:hypothetical protein